MATIVPPDYTGGGLVNLVATLAARWGVDTGHVPLQGSDGLTDGTERVLLFVCDALGYLELQGHLAHGVMPRLAARLSSGEAQLRTLTSVFPSTTAAALSTLHTGATPAEHGHLGYGLWLDGDDGVTDMLQGRDRATGAERPWPPSRPALTSRLSATGVCCRAVNAAAFAGSPLSRWHFAGADYRPWYGIHTVPTLVADALQGAGPIYVTAYWPEHDTLCHAYGPDSAQIRDEAAALDFVFDRLLGRLPRDGNTLVLLTGDHGQRRLRPEAAVFLNDLGAGAPGGERCAVYLRDRPGLAAALAPYATIHPMDAVWSAGWFGGPPTDTGFRRRTGDLLALPRDGWQLLWRGFVTGMGAEPHRGGHGGLTADEMLVPLVTLRL